MSLIVSTDRSPSVKCERNENPGFQALRIWNCCWFTEAESIGSIIYDSSQHHVRVQRQLVTFASIPITRYRPLQHGC